MGLYGLILQKTPPLWEHQIQHIKYVTYNEFYLTWDTRAIVECGSVTTFTQVVDDDDQERDSFYNLKHTRQ
jgi:hypothetical protein